MTDLIGKKFNRLTVIRKMNNNKYGRTCWLCKCVCGQETVVDSNSLQAKNTKSCGCLRKETAGITGLIHTKHGHARHGQESKIYRTWSGILTRCNNINDKSYANYGGRGIRVCNRWRKFENFLEDMGEPPTPKHSIERINNSENYYKLNCIWTTSQNQARNRRNNRLVTFRNKIQCLAAWADEYGIKYGTLWSRLYVYHWPMEKSLREST